MEYVQKVIQEMLLDQGLDPSVPVELPEYNAECEKIDWARVNTFLGTLSQDELATFAVGDATDMGEIANRNAEGAYAHLAMEELFMVIGG